MYYDSKQWLHIVISTISTILQFPSWVAVAGYPTHGSPWSGQPRSIPHTSWGVRPNVTVAGPPGDPRWMVISDPGNIPMPPSPLYALQWFRPFSSPICALCQPVDKEILKPFCGKCQEGLTEHNSGDGWASSLIGLAWARATKKNSSQSYWAKGQMLKELKHPKMVSWWASL